jgi:hypothetical protein
MIAQVWTEPAEIANAPVSPVTVTGIELALPPFVPLPSCPKLLLPQHSAVPSESRAQV